MHDRPVTRDEVIYSGIVDPEIWEQIEEIALLLFERGTELAAARGLVLVDTKYEFGVRDDRIVLVDELHTPDSSRYWYADTYEERFEAGREQRRLDKEYLRQWLADQGYSGEGHAPAIPDDVFAEVSRRYQEAFEAIMGVDFRAQSTNSEAEKEKLLSFVEERQEEN